MKPEMGRPAVRASGGMVATSQPLAVEIGVQALRDGGSAADAAIAANIALGLVEPMSCGLGGDLFALVAPRGGELVGLNASGRAPRRLSIDVFRERGLERVPLRGPLSWTVPGCVAGWAALHARFGRLPWAALFEPTIEAARTGFRVTPVIGAAWAADQRLLATDPGSSTTYLVDGRPPAVGALFRNPALADALSAVAMGGPAAFYEGDVGAMLARRAREVGSPLSRQDLAEHAYTWVAPLGLSYRDVEVWELPPNTQGAVVLEIMNILAALRVETLASDAAAHAFIEAKKLAYENRALFYADPRVARAPVERLLRSEHGRAQAAHIAPERAASSVPSSDLWASDTVYVTAVDRERNAVSLIQSLYYGFGSGVTPVGLGFAMQNRGALFSLDPAHPNALAPGKRPFHTLIPAMVTRGGRAIFSFGVMGGDMQPQGHVQVLLRLLLDGLDPQRAGDAARIRHDGSSTPTGDAMRDGGIVHLEPEVDAEVADGLRRRGHRVEVSAGGYGGYQGIWIDWASGSLLGGSESRKDGMALGI